MKIFVSALALTVALATAASAQSFYGVSYDPLSGTGQLLTVDGATGQGTATGTLAAGIAPGGVAASGGSLYAFDTATDRVDQINPFDGTTVKTFGVGLSGLSGAGGFAFGPGGTGYVSAPLGPGSAFNGGIYSLNLAAGTSTRLGTASDALEALAFGPGGTLYGLGKGDAALYAVSTVDGSLTPLGALTSDGGATFVGGGTPAGGLAFGPGGTLYAAADDKLYTVGLTPTAGAGGPFLTATLIDPAKTGTGIGYAGVSGLVSAAAVTVPEPGAFALLGLGLLPALLVVRRRKCA